MEFSLYTSNITSVLWELDRSCSTKLSRDSTTSANVLWFSLSLYTRAIASIIQDDGWGITSANETLFCSSFARAALFVFLNDPAAVDNDHRSGPSGWLTTSLIWRFWFSAINIIWANGFLSAFRMISFDVLLLACTFLFRSVNVCSLAFGIVSWNLVWSGCDSSRSTRKLSYAFSPTASAVSKSCYIFRGATFPVERHTRSCCTLVNGSNQWLWSIVSRDLTSVSVSSLTILVLWRSVWWKYPVTI